jgi:hypothetical protein
MIDVDPSPEDVGQQSARAFALTRRSLYVALRCT